MGDVPRRRTRLNGGFEYLCYLGFMQTWPQRYFIRKDFWQQGGPVFLCMGGEGPPLDGYAPVCLCASPSLLSLE